MDDCTLKYIYPGDLLILNLISGICENRRCLQIIEFNQHAIFLYSSDISRNRVVMRSECINSPSNHENRFEEESVANLREIQRCVCFQVNGLLNIKPILSIN
jgi:hypothetical protein